METLTWDFQGGEFVEGAVVFFVRLRTKLIEPLSLATGCHFRLSRVAWKSCQIKLKIWYIRDICRGEGIGCNELCLSFSENIIIIASFSFEKGPNRCQRRHIDD